MTLYLVKRLEQVARSLLDGALRPYGLTALQYTALSVLSRHEGVSSAGLARRSFVTPQTMHTMVQALERRGLVERRLAPRNRRELLITLTAAGRDLVVECTEVVAVFDDHLHAEMDDTEHQHFRSYLERGYAALLPLVGPETSTQNSD